jgi:transcription initiation factor IIF auxiliary subunit
MTISLDNHARLNAAQSGRRPYYDWEVFVNESNKVLDKIDHVVYFLHETFPNPVRTATNRKNRFSLRTAGWGEFQINAQIVFKDGHLEHAEHQLDLKKPWMDGPPHTWDP